MTLVSPLIPYSGSGRFEEFHGFVDGVRRGVTARRRPSRGERQLGAAAGKKFR